MKTVFETRKSVDDVVVGNVVVMLGGEACRDCIKVRRCYDSHLYLGNFNEASWVSIEGQYLTSDTLEKPQEFLFNFIGLTDDIGNSNGF